MQTLSQIGPSEPAGALGNYPFNHANNKNAEVIDAIHENPELLK